MAKWTKQRAMAAVRRAGKANGRFVPVALQARIAKAVCGSGPSIWSIYHSLSPDLQDICKDILVVWIPPAEMREEYSEEWGLDGVSEGESLRRLIEKEAAEKAAKEAYKASLAASAKPAPAAPAAPPENCNCVYCQMQHWQ